MRRIGIIRYMEEDVSNMEAKDGPFMIGHGFKGNNFSHFPQCARRSDAPAVPIADPIFG